MKDSSVLGDFDVGRMLCSRLSVHMIGTLSGEMLDVCGIITAPPPKSCEYTSEAVQGDMTAPTKLHFVTYETLFMKSNFIANGSGLSNIKRQSVYMQTDKQQGKLQPSTADGTHIC